MPVQALAVAMTDAAGRAVLAGVADTRVHLVVSAEGMAVEDIESACPPESPPREVTVRLRPAATLAGVVRDLGGDPMTGFVVCVSPPDTGNGPAPSALVRWVSIDADGGYRVDDLAPGVYEVRTWSPGGSGASLDVVRIPQVRTFDPEVTLGGTVYGRVIDARTRGPVVGATVTLVGGVDRPTGPVVGSAVSREDGAYVVRTCKRFTQLVAASVKCRGCAPLDVDVLAERRTNGLQWFAPFRRDFVLEPQASLEGHVSDSAGPVPGARVVVTFLNRRNLRPVEVATRADGSYLLDGLPSGEVAVRAFPGPWAPGPDVPGSAFDPSEDLPRSALTTLISGVTRSFDIRVPRNTGPAWIETTVTGHVVFPDGKPAAWAVVCGPSDSECTVSGADGAYSLRLSGIAGRRAYAFARLPGWESGFASCILRAAETSGTRLLLERTPVLRGVVYNRDGNPVVGARVRVGRHVTGKGGPFAAWEANPEGVSDDNGTFEIPIASVAGEINQTTERDVVLSVESSSHAPRLTQPIDCGDPRAREHVAVVLDDGDVIGGSVAWAESGQPAAGIAIRVTPMPGGESLRYYEWPPSCPPSESSECGETVETESGPAGLWSINHLVAGTYQIAVDGPGIRRCEVLVTSPRRDPVELRLVRVGGIAGVVVGADNGPVAAARVEIAPIVPGDQEEAPCTVSGPDGAFEFPELLIGDVRLRVSPPLGAGLSSIVIPRVRVGLKGLRIRLDAAH